MDSNLDPTQGPETAQTPLGGAASRPARARTALLLVGVALLLLVLGAAATMLKRVRDNRVLAKETAMNVVPTVTTIHAVAGKPDEELVLPGSLQAFEESPIYARTNGYLVRWYKDIGSRVKKGDLLAQIDTPEVDQELSQARAGRQQAQAQMELAEISAERWQNLRKTDSVSQQEADQQASGLRQSRANLAAADANVRRLEQLESFKNVYAPFAGVLTKRNVDAGALINAGSGGKEMFDIARVETLRVFVSVPQAYSPAIKRGMKAWITLQEFPGEKFEGQVARTSDAIDPATRTLLTEIDVSNKAGRLLPGSFGQAHFRVEAASRKVMVPVNAILFGSEGPRLAIVGNDGKVHLKPIVIGRDYGATLEILGGVTVDEQIINNPADSLEEGQTVHVAPANQGGGQS